MEVDKPKKQNKNVSSTENVNQSKRPKTSKNVNEELDQLNNPGNGKTIVLNGATSMDNPTENQKLSLTKGKSISVLIL